MSSVEVTGTALREAWRNNVAPGPEQVRPGLWSIPVPIPNNPLRYVIVYVFETPSGAVVVDAGWSTEEAWDALTSGLETAGFSVSEVRGAIITHIHPDHYGLAGRLRSASGAWVALHPADAALLPARYGIDIETLIGNMQSLLRQCGVPETDRDELTSASMGIREFVQLAEPDVLLEDRKQVDVGGWNLVALHTPGHSPGHVCLHEPDRRLLISGDHVLPRISPNISVHAQQPGNPLAEFLDSLQRVRALDVDEVLPAHEWRFRGLQARVDELVRHHSERMDETERLVRDVPGCTCWDITRRLSWSRDWNDITGFMRRAAVGETLAHLVLLESRGRLRRSGLEPMRWSA